MANIIDFTNAVFNAAYTTAGITNDYIQNRARLATQTKQIKLEEDVINLMDNLRRNGDSTKWQTDANTFFESVKSGMSDKNSPYYCDNNLQAQMFNSILENSRVGVNQKLGQMVFTADRDKALVNYKDSLSRLKKLTAGQQFIDQANELARGLKDSGYIDDQQYSNLLDQHYETAYTTLIVDTFDKSIEGAINSGENADSLFQKVRKNADDLMGSDIAGLPKSFDREVFDKTALAQCKQIYNARLSDIQQGNANKLAAIVQEMRQQNSAEGKLNVALRGQMAMNTMDGLKLSENDRLQYSAIFDLSARSGSGSGAKASDFDSYEKLIKAAPETAIQLIEDGTVENPYDAIRVVSGTMQRNWFTQDYRENFNKDAAERNETFNLMYKGQTSEESLTDVISKKVLEKYPSAQNLINNNYKNLLTDIQKNPKKYGSATVGELADYMTNWALGANKNATDEDFVEGLQNHINDCYVESIKYVELDKKGKLEKKFNSNSEKDIAKAARLASEKDYVFTYQGQERWAEGKKEALEAEGGIVDVLKSAVAGTLDVPAGERGQIGYYYKPDPEHDDMTSTPIITYKNKAYEVVANDGDKGFRLREVHTGEEIEGKLGGAKAKEERIAQKAESKDAVASAHDATRQVEEKRISNTNEAIANAKEMPKAMKSAGGVKASEWENGDQTARQIYLQDTENAINKDYKKVKNKKMTQEEFREKYGIYFYDWDQTSEKTARYNLILNS